MRIALCPETSPDDQPTRLDFLQSDAVPESPLIALPHPPVFAAEEMQHILSDRASQVIAVFHHQTRAAVPPVTVRQPTVFADVMQPLTAGSIRGMHRADLYQTRYPILQGFNRQGHEATCIHRGELTTGNRRRLRFGSDQ